MSYSYLLEKYKTHQFESVHASVIPEGREQLSRTVLSVLLAGRLHIRGTPVALPPATDAPSPDRPAALPPIAGRGNTHRAQEEGDQRAGPVADKTSVKINGNASATVSSLCP